MIIFIKKKKLNGRPQVRRSDHPMATAGGRPASYASLVEASMNYCRQRRVVEGGSDVGRSSRCWYWHSFLSDDWTCCTVSTANGVVRFKPGYSGKVFRQLMEGLGQLVMRCRSPLGLLPVLVLCQRGKWNWVNQENRRLREEGDGGWNWLLSFALCQAGATVW
jgi:hypothetical protein